VDEEDERRGDEGIAERNGLVKRVWQRGSCRVVRSGEQEPGDSLLL
jgi:hypothetical protein